jgi:hypothetical protein
MTEKESSAWTWLRDNVEAPLYVRLFALEISKYIADGETSGDYKQVYREDPRMLQIKEWWNATFNKV